MHERDVIGTDMVHYAKCGHFFASDSVLQLIEEAKAGKVINEFSAESLLSSEDERELREEALLYIIPDPQKRESFLRELDNSGLDHLSIEAILAMLPGYDI
jgi:hypothetical protein